MIREIHSKNKAYERTRDFRLIASRQNYITYSKR